MNDALIENGMVVQGEPDSIPFSYEPDYVCENCDTAHGLEWDFTNGRFCKACVKRAYEGIKALVVKDAQTRNVMVDPAVIALLDFIGEGL